MRWPKRRLGLRAWRAKELMLCPHAVTDEDGHPLENEDGSGRRLCECWGATFQARAEGPRHHPFVNCSMLRKLLTTSVGSLIEKNLMNSLF